MVPTRSPTDTQLHSNEINCGGQTSYYIKYILYIIIILNYYINITSDITYKIFLTCNFSTSQRPKKISEEKFPIDDKIFRMCESVLLIYNTKIIK